jgi:hypothetical protein
MAHLATHSARLEVLASDTTGSGAAMANESPPRLTALAVRLNAALSVAAASRRRMATVSRLLPGVASCSR